MTNADLAQAAIDNLNAVAVEVQQTVSECNARVNAKVLELTNATSVLQQQATTDEAALASIASQSQQLATSIDNIRQTIDGIGR